MVEIPACKLHHQTWSNILCVGARVRTQPPREPNPNSRCGAQGTRDHPPHAARPASGGNQRARPIAPPGRAGSRPQTDAPGRGQGTRETADGQTPNQRERTPHTGRKTGRPARENP
ncbi:basic salivary proline-rich protein 4-like [Nerophis ophidion]|uniref:basic salivary proline-rich protein 4-like n=1 Tax=Nerophis ophidion TaxID=159077 RepID=UPI002AE0124C|nr:basic salivary proline-rich protein 4-like [Nerophis ophidion]